MMLQIRFPKVVDDQSSSFNRPRPATPGPRGFHFPRILEYATGAAETAAGRVQVAPLRLAFKTPGVMGPQAQSDESVEMLRWLSCRQRVGTSCTYVVSENPVPLAGE